MKQKGTSVECSRLNEKLKRITSLYVTHLKSSARSVHETVHPHISFQPSIMTRMRSPNANCNNKNTKEMKHCWEHAVSDRISQGKKKKKGRHTRTHNSQWYAPGQFVNAYSRQDSDEQIQDEATFEFRADDRSEVSWCGGFVDNCIAHSRTRRGRPTTWAALGRGSLTMHSDNYVVRTHRQPKHNAGHAAETQGSQTK